MSSAPREAKCTICSSCWAGTGRIHAVGVALVAACARGAAALGAVRAETSTALPRRRPGSGTAPTTSGITSPAFRTMTRSPGRTSFTATWSCVVQRRHRDRRAGDDDRLEHREGRGASRAPDRDLDREQPRRALLGRELPRDRPARRATRKAQSRAFGEVVDLDHRRRRCRSAGRGGVPRTSRCARSSPSTPISIVASLRRQEAPLGAAGRSSRGTYVNVIVAVEFDQLVSEERQRTLRA